MFSRSIRTVIASFVGFWMQIFMARVKRIFRDANGQDVETSSSSDTVER